MSVPEPAPKIALKVGRPSPADSPAPQTNGSNGTPANGASRRNPFGGSSATPMPHLEQLDRARSMSGSAPSPTPSGSAAIKHEEIARNSPALQAANYNYRAPSQAVSTPGLPGAVMPPPSTPGVPPQNMYSASGYAQSFPHPAMYAQNPAVDNRWRPEGQSKMPPYFWKTFTDHLKPLLMP
jgi:hypothetical protein